jgi:hypothetical protein
MLRVLTVFGTRPEAIKMASRMELFQSGFSRVGSVGWRIAPCGLTQGRLKFDRVSNSGQNCS